MGSRAHPPVRGSPSPASRAAVLAACGGGTRHARLGNTRQGAELVAAGMPVFVAIDGNFDSGQWTAARRSSSASPPAARRSTAPRELTEGGAHFETELKPALGPEVDDRAHRSAAGRRPAGRAADPAADPRKFERCCRGQTSRRSGAMSTAGTWWPTTRRRSSRALTPGDSLADVDAFEVGDGRPAGETLARIYLDGPALTRGGRSGRVEQGGLGQLGPNAVELLGAGDKLEYAALALVAEEQGLRVEGVARSEQAPGLEPAAAELPGLVPADALLYGSFNGLDHGLSQFLETMGKQTPDFDRTLAQLELALGVSVEDDLAADLRGRGRPLRSRRGADPRGDAVLSPDDPAKAGATLDKLVAAAALFGPGGEGAASPRAPSRTRRSPVLTRRSSRSTTRSRVYYATVDGHLVSRRRSRASPTWSRTVPIAGRRPALPRGAATPPARPTRRSASST